jgi:hypothetical protein
MRFTRCSHSPGPQRDAWLGSRVANNKSRLTRGRRTRDSLLSGFSCIEHSLVQKSHSPIHDTIEDQKYSMNNRSKSYKEHESAAQSNLSSMANRIPIMKHATAATPSANIPRRNRSLEFAPSFANLIFSNWQVNSILVSAFI